MIALAAFPAGRLAAAKYYSAPKRSIPGAQSRAAIHFARAQTDLTATPRATPSQRRTRPSLSSSVTA